MQNPEQSAVAPNSEVVGATQQSSSQFPPRDVIRDADLREYGLNRVSAWRLEKTDPTFPRRIIIQKDRNGNPSITGRLRHELDEWFSKRPRVV
ncbi:MAG: hypothetical protein ACI8P9_005403 [Parasphingorhabdus sp.]|jgi:hypothetical protein